MEDKEVKIAIPPYVVNGRSMLENDIIEIPMLWGHLLQKYGIAVLAGSSDTGKSSLLRQLATAIVSGETQFLNYDLKATHRSVIIVSSEDDEDSMSAIIKREKIEVHSNEAYENLRFIFDVSGIEGKLKAELKRQSADCVIIDALSDFIPGEMNSVNNVRQFYNNYRAITVEFKCLILFLHHTRKSASDITPSKYDLLGSQGLEAKPRSVLMLSIDEKKDDIRYLTLVKGNYTTSGHKRDAIALKTNANFIFEYSGIVENIVDLLKPSSRKLTPEVKRRITALRIGPPQLTIDEIKNTLSQEGIDISRSTIATFTKSVDSQ